MQTLSLKTTDDNSPTYVVAFDVDGLITHVDNKPAFMVWEKNKFVLMELQCVLDFRLGNDEKIEDVYPEIFDDLVM